MRTILAKLAGLGEREKKEITIVGGFVRDALRGVESCDLDLIVSEEADQFAKKAAVVLRGEYDLLEAQSQYSRITLETSDGRPFSLDLSLRQGQSVEDDLARRDFTVNAMGVNLNDYLSRSDWKQCVIDPCGGVEDLYNGILRVTSTTSLQDDPVRLVRAVRFKLRLKFNFAPETEAALQRNAPLIRRAQKMKLAIELFQLLAQPYAVEGLRMLQNDLKILPPFFPPFYRMAVMHVEGENLFDHGLQVCRCLETIVNAKGRLDEKLQNSLQTHLHTAFEGERPRMAYLRLACLLHDIGKVDGGRCGEPANPSFNHEIAAEEFLANLAKQLCLKEEEERYLVNMVCNHSRSVFLNVEEFGPRLRFFRQFHGMAPEMILLSMANNAARYGHNTALASDLASLLNGCFQGQFATLTEPLLSAQEIMEFFNLPPVRPVGKLMEHVYCAQLEGRVKNRTEALNMVSRLLDERKRDTKQEV